MPKSALYLGRFQPFHLGHLAVVKMALQKHERVIIGIGSAEENLTPENTLTASERFVLIEECLKAEGISSEQFCIIPIRNINNYALWPSHVNLLVPPYETIYTGSDIVEECFKQSKNTKPIIKLSRINNISASKIRQLIINDQPWQNLVPQKCAELLNEWGIAKRLKSVAVN